MKMQSSVLMVAAAVAGIVLIVVSAESGPPAARGPVDPTPVGPAGPAGPVEPGTPLPPDHPPLDGAGAPTPVGEATMSGVVQEVIPASRYVYLRVESPDGSGGSGDSGDFGEPLWIATGAVDVEEGSRIAFGDGTLMRDFYSRSLDRTFERILFVTTVQVVS